MIINYLRKFRIILNSKQTRFIYLLMGGNLVGAVSGFITSIIILRKLNHEGIALLYPLMSILMVTEQIGDLGISTSFIKLASSLKSKNIGKYLSLCNLFFKTKILLAFLVLGLGQLLAVPISQWIFHTSDSVPWVRVILFIASISVMSTFHQCYLQIGSQFRSLTLARAIPSTLKVVVLLLIMWFGRIEFEGAFIAFVIIPIGTAFLCFSLSDTDYLRGRSEFKADFPQIFHFSKWIVISTLSVSLIGQIDIFMLRSMREASEIARLVGGSRLASIFLILSSSLITVLFPTISSLTTKAEIKTYLRRFVLIIPPLTFLLTLLMIFSPWIISFLLGTRYESAISVFRIFCLQFAIDFIITPFGLTLYNLNKVHILSLMNFCQLLIMILSNYLLIPVLGAEGSAISGLIIRCFACLVILHICKKEGLIGTSSR